MRSECSRLYQIVDIFSTSESFIFSPKLIQAGGGWNTFHSYEAELLLSSCLTPPPLPACQPVVYPFSVGSPLPSLLGTFSLLGWLASSILILQGLIHPHSSTHLHSEDKDHILQSQRNLLPSGNVDKVLYQVKVYDLQT